MFFLKNIIGIVVNFNVKAGKIFSWLLLLMVILTFVIVVLRYLFNIGFIWMQELVRFFYSAVFLICAAYTLAEDSHVRVDIFYSKLSDKGKSIVNILGSFIFLIPVCIITFYYSFNYVINSWAQLEGSLEERGLHAVFIMKSFIWLFSFMLLGQGVAIIVNGINKIWRQQ